MTLLGNVFNSIGALHYDKQFRIHRIRLLHPIGLIIFIISIIYVFIRVGIDGFIDEINDTYVLW
jgi:hypothetical protein